DNNDGDVCRSDGWESRSDETIHEERGDRVERAATTASSLEAEQDSGNIHRTQSVATLNEPIPQGTGSGSGPRRQDIILGDRPAQTRVLALENIKTVRDLEITNLKKRVKRILFVQEDAETHGRYGHDIEVNIASTLITTASINITTVEPVTTVSALVTTVDVSVSTVEPSTHPTTTTTGIEDEDLISAQALMKMRSEKSKERKSKEKSSETATRPTKGVIMKEASETTTRPTIPPQQQLDPKDKGKGKMVEREKPLKKKDHIEFDKLLRDYKLKVVEGSGKKSESNGKEVVSKKRTRKGLDEEIVKRQKLEDDDEKEELKYCLEIVPNDDKVINIEPLATKSPIVDWETQILGEELFYYQIKRADGSYKVYMVLYAMLNDFDRKDLIDLYRLVKERFKTTRPEGYDRLL
nr:hypothetical protein [Tanacetum cinerariifolium]GEV89596.1 hypothetical protein [Tanacetum cinerariifolium]GEV91894.1 hypothetical protein [Tanacetum cinerariifolium]